MSICPATKSLDKQKNIFIKWSLRFWPHPRVKGNENVQTKMVTSIIRHKDCLSIAELARRFIVVALDACTPPKLLKRLKRRVTLVKPKTSFQSFIETQKFSQLVKILKNERCNFQTWLPDSTTLEKRESALHLIMKYNPTVEVVELLILQMKRIRPKTNPVTYQDEYGMTPLHVAVARSCDARIIELLVFGSGTSADERNVAGIADCHHRYPLHYICTIPSRIQKDVSKKRAISIFNDTLRILRCLVVSFPAAIDSPDKNGWTAKQMAESLAADGKVLEILQNPSMTMQLCRTQLVKQSSVVTPATSCETAEVLGLPFDEIHCYKVINVNDTDYEDDVSTIGWNTTLETPTASKNHSKSNKRDKMKAQIEVVNLSINEINVDMSKFKKEFSQKYRFL
jgi:Ankyrin repeats (3 copies)